ncbi:HNH endonuclease [Gordonia phage Gibbles]|nr:HNH endonuclease [Gordonia phage Gibbles]
MVAPFMKKCQRCGITKSYSCFNKRAASSDGLQSYCKECVKAYRDNKRYVKKPDTAPVGQDRMCSTCRNVYDISCFHKKGGGKIRSECKFCVSARWTRYSQNKAG